MEHKSHNPMRWHTWHIACPSLSISSHFLCSFWLSEGLLEMSYPHGVHAGRIFFNPDHGLCLCHANANAVEWCGTAKVLLSRFATISFVRRMRFLTISDRGTPAFPPHRAGCANGVLNGTCQEKCTATLVWTQPCASLNFYEPITTYTSLAGLVMPLVYVCVLFLLHLVHLWTSLNILLEYDAKNSKHDFHLVLSPPFSMVLLLSHSLPFSPILSLPSLPSLSPFPLLSMLSPVLSFLFCCFVKAQPQLKLRPSQGFGLSGTMKTTLRRSLGKLSEFSATKIQQKEDRRWFGMLRIQAGQCSLLLWLSRSSEPPLHCLQIFWPNHAAVHPVQPHHKVPSTVGWLQSCCEKT